MSGHRLAKAVAEFSLWGLGDVLQPEAFIQLQGGLTNESYRFQLKGRTYVLRLFAENSWQLNINRDAEFHISGLAYANNLGAKPVYMDPNKTYAVFEFLSGHLLNHADLDESQRLSLLAKNLNRLHKLGVNSLVPTLDVTVKAENYWQAISAQGLTAYLVNKEGLQHFFSALPGPDALCLCHNDLVFENMIYQDGELRFIDWEYAALGNPYFDLASVIVNRQLDGDLAAPLLENYYLPINYEYLAAAIMQVKYLEALWWVIQQDICAEVGEKKFEELLAITVSV